MISKTLVVLLGLLIIACGGTVEPVVPTLTPSPVVFATALPPTAALPAFMPSPALPTLAPFSATIPPPTSANPWQRAGNTLANFLQGDGAADTVYKAFSRAAVDLLQYDLVADDDAHTDRLRDALKQTITALKLSVEIEPRVLVISIVATGERQEIITFGFVGTQGVPIVMLLRRGATIKPISPEVFGAFDGDGKRWAWLRELRTIDVTGDGVNELVTGYVHSGGSSSQNELEIFRWDESKNNFKHIFRGYLVDWIGESDFTFLKNGRSTALQISFPWFGSFSAKMIDHVRGTEEWTYDAAIDAMVRSERSIESSRTVLQQLNIAERLFRNGQLKEALREFDRAATDSVLTDPPFGGIARAPRGFAHFRQGQILALLGQETEARSQFAKAEQVGGSLAAMTKAYLAHYEGTEAGLRAWARLSEFDIVKEFRELDGASNLDFPTNAYEILFQGGVVAAYLNKNSTTQDNLEQRVLEVDSPGFPFGQVRVLDWDGDGQNEALYVTPVGSGKQVSDTLWLVYQRQGLWRARQILWADNGQDLEVLNTLRLPKGSGQAIGVSWESNQRYEQRWSWDGNFLRQLDFQTLEPLATYDNQYKVGTLPEPIDF